MRKLTRAGVVPPASLTTPSAAVRDEQHAATNYYGARAPWTAAHVAYQFRYYGGEDVKAAVRKLTEGSCAYCESKIGAVGADEVEHYRPKGGITGVPGHPGYWWLAHRWDNLLPTCRDCNKSLRQHIVTPGMTKAEVEALLVWKAADSHGKANQFDILGQRAVSDACDHDAEDPLLIDPCGRDPAEHLKWDFKSELTLIEAKTGAQGLSPYGAYTIRVCALNRAELVLDRILPLRPMRALRLHIENRINDWAGDQQGWDAIQAEIDVLTSFAEPGQPYAGMAGAFVDELIEQLFAWREERGLPPA